MGAWGTGPFENDDALDLVGEINDSEPDAVAELLTDILDVPDPDEEMDEVDGTEAYAVAALLAAKLERLEVTSPDVLDAVSKIPTEVVGALLPNARTMLTRILGENSEFAELWIESGRLEKIRGEIGKIQRALR
ncbi:DUF4259 domain-containing protein [Blastococcus sp. Marseille-P5729]|uniref:DUF4259 domain-containing protein n=1 Tax=Blastococcus sp. Marseille-P5729 TaxID=2086582 RepID=UPI000D110295|nr:DUF4259 domain-containing protein [Blastococcus sp. Marseille-P5729]